MGILFDVKYLNVKRHWKRMTAQKRDTIAGFIDGWKRERPDLDAWPLGILGRVQRLDALLVRRTEQWLAEYDLTWEAFSLIVTLRRAGKPYELRPGEINRQSLLSSGAVTNRIDRVEKLGLVERRPDARDRRGVVVRLTAKGRTLADRAIERQFAELAGVMEDLTKPERAVLGSLLSKLLLSLESDDSVPGVAPDSEAPAPKTKPRR
jgi:DNA-binding MarR family transcriptional regulator